MSLLLLKELIIIFLFGEFGRFPIYNHICESISKFYFHAKGKEPDSLLNQTLQTNIQLHKDGFKSWYSGMKAFLNELNLMKKIFVHLFHS